MAEREKVNRKERKDFFYWTEIISQRRKDAKFYIIMTLYLREVNPKKDQA